MDSCPFCGIKLIEEKDKKICPKCGIIDEEIKSDGEHTGYIG